VGSLAKGRVRRVMRMRLGGVIKIIRSGEGHKGSKQMLIEIKSPTAKNTKNDVGGIFTGEVVFVPHRGGKGTGMETAERDRFERNRWRNGGYGGSANEIKWDERSNRMKESPFHGGVSLKKDFCSGRLDPKGNGRGLGVRFFKIGEAQRDSGWNWIARWERSSPWEKRGNWFERRGGGNYIWERVG